MHSARRSALLLAAITVVTASLSAFGQVVVATLPAGTSPYALAVNSVTNKIYLANYCGSDPTCASSGTVTVIDGATNNTATVNVGVSPSAIAVNSTTNKIYVANYCGSDLTCSSSGTVTVIDGATNNTATVNVGVSPSAMAINPVTNKIYVANDCGSDLTCSSLGTVTVINGLTLGTVTVNVGAFPGSVAVNSTTNRIYVANDCGSDLTCSSLGTATIIDGNTDNTTTVNVGVSPSAIAVNPVTNKIYVTNNCGNDLNCASLGTVTVIDGNTNNATSINVGAYPYDVEVNSTTNMIYAVNNCGNDLTCSSAGTVTSINGSSLSTVTVNVGFSPYFAAVDSTTNEIYVANNCGSDSTCQSPGTAAVINGVTNSVFPVALGDAPFALALNTRTDKIYAPNYLDSTVSIIAGDTALRLITATPCRLVDTRGGQGGGTIQGGTYETFNLPQLAQTYCPGLNLSSAASYSLNITLIPSGGHPVGYLTVWPASQFQPNVSTMNSDGRVKADAAIISAGVAGEVNVFVAATADVLLDIDGYFAPSNSSTQQFYSLTPCRVADTRSSSYPSGLGSPSLVPGVERDFPVRNSPCFQQVPSGVTVAAYSFNFTALPKGPLGYLTIWPTGQTMPVVSTLNAPTGANTANAAIVPAGTPNGEISAYTSPLATTTDLLIDVNGYFAAPGTGGLSLYPTPPCRVLDTRSGNGAFGQTLSPPVDVLGSPCGVASQSQTYVFNATVLPQGSLGYLTLWPYGQNQPAVSTLNAGDGAITSNMAIVASGTQGKINAYAGNGTTNLLLDISAFFAP
jgi:DNA-binding beta-propeller fold protein YncE